MSIKATRPTININEQITTLRGECSVDSIIHQLKDYRGGIDIGPGGHDQPWKIGTFRFVSDTTALMIAESTDITSTSEIRAHNADGNSGGVYVGGSQFTPVGILANRLSLYTSTLDGINIASWKNGADIKFYSGQNNDYQMRVTSTEVEVGTQRFVQNACVIKRQTFDIDSNGDPTTNKRRVVVKLANYNCVRVKIAAQRTNANDSLVYWEGYINNNDNVPYATALHERATSGNISYTFGGGSVNGSVCDFVWDFNSTISPADGTIVIEAVRGDGEIVIGNY